MTLGALGIFGFPVLVTFEIGFSVLALKISGFSVSGIHCGFRFFLFWHSIFGFYELKKVVFRVFLRSSIPDLSVQQ